MIELSPATRNLSASAEDGIFLSSIAAILFYLLIGELLDSKTKAAIATELAAVPQELLLNNYSSDLFTKSRNVCDVLRMKVS